MTDARRVLLLNGPNLNLLGTREPDVYGTTTLADIERVVEQEAAALGLGVRAFQSNHEGELVQAVQDAARDCAAIIINPAAYSHTSVAIRDALAAVALPVVEVHLSNIHKREEFRHHSYVSGVADVVVCGAGIDGYTFAVEQAARLIET